MVLCSGLAAWAVERWQTTGTAQYVLHWQGKGMKIKQGVFQWSTLTFQMRPL
jgi:hypothetical protein